MLPTPDILHLRQPEFRDAVYEPAEDTFLLLDALEQDQAELEAQRPTLCLEIGSGSGCVMTFLARLLGHSSAVFICADINPVALAATRMTGDKNSVSLELVRGDLASPFLGRLNGMVDVLLFNPPYVPTESEEIDGNGIEVSWAGGKDGMEVTNRLLPRIKELLAPKGRFYLVAVEENKPNDILNTMESCGLKGSIVIRRAAGREKLYILRFDN